MTSPASGRADFQTTAQWTSDVTTFPSTAYPAGTTVVESPDVVNWLTYRVSGQSSSGAGGIEVRAWADAAHTVLVDTGELIIAGTRAFSMAFPVITPYVTLEVSNPNAGAFTIELFTSLSNVPVPKPTSLGVPEMSEVNFGSIAAGATKTDDVFGVVPGDAYIYFSDEDHSGKLIFTIQAYNASGVLQNTIRKDYHQTVPTHLVFEAPINSLAIQVHNDDTVSHTYSYALVQTGR